jgi:O-antigen/teichoic acid export membrane protein
MSELARAAAGGLRWSALGQLGRQATLLATTVLLSRLLGPESLGLMSMAVVVLGFLELFRDLGSGAAVVQRRELGPALLDTLFWLNLAAGLACAALLVALAPLAARFFGEPAVAPLLQLLALGVVVNSLGVVQQALLQRAVAFRAIAGVELVAALCGAIVAVALALSGAGVWSLAAQSLATALTATPLFWLLSGFHPRLRFDPAALRAVAGFSGGLVGFNVVNYAARNADNLLIGRVLGPASLGLYSLAYRLMLYPVQLLAQIATRVLFPLLSRVEDEARFRRAYLELSAAIALVAAPIYVAMGALSDPLALALLGPAWAGAAPLLAIFAPVGLFQALTNPTGLIYQARGRTDLLLAWGVGSSAVMVAAFVIGLRWGATGVAAAYALSMLLLAYPVFALPFRLIGLPVAALLRTLWPCLVCAAGMLLVLLAARLALAALPPVAQLALALPAGLLVYLALSWWLNRAPLLACLRLVRPGGSA